MRSPGAHSASPRPGSRSRSPGSSVSTRVPARRQTRGELGLARRLVFVVPEIVTVVLEIAGHVVADRSELLASCARGATVTAVTTGAAASGGSARAGHARGAA